MVSHKSRWFLWPTEVLGGLHVVGLHGCIIACGPCGSGKSHTIFGGRQQEHQGLVPRLAEGIFRLLRAKNEKHIVKFSYLELYNEPGALRGLRKDGVSSGKGVEEGGKLFENQVKTGKKAIGSLRFRGVWWICCSRSGAPRPSCGIRHWRSGSTRGSASSWAVGPPQIACGTC